MSPIERIILWSLMAAYVLAEVLQELIEAIHEAYSAIENDSNNPSGGNY